MATKFDGRLLKAVHAIVRRKPISSDTLLAELGELGIKRVDLSHIYLLAHEGAEFFFDERTNLWTAGRSPSTHTQADTNEASSSARSVQRSNILFRAEARDLRSKVLPPEEQREQVPPIYSIDPSWQTIAGEARNALKAEFRAVLRRRTQLEISLVDGHVVDESPTRKILRYEIQSSDSIREGTRATLHPAEQSSDTSQQKPVECEVLTQYGSDLTLIVAPDCPFWKDARIRYDLSWLVGRQVEIFDRLLQGMEPGFSSTAALAPVCDRGLLDEVPDVEPYYIDGLNERQQLAVGHGLEPRITWLWGPPGTGKTTTIAALLNELLDADRTVLISAPTNAAIDVALLALLKRRQNFSAGEIVRIGASETPGIAARALPVLLDEIAAKNGHQVAKRLGEIRSELDQLREKAKRDGKKTDGEILRRIADLKSFQTELETLMREVRDQVVADAKLVACTTHQVLLRELHRKGFHTVVIDEASMVTAAMAMLVAGVGDGHSVIAGDFRQLPPIVQAEEPQSRMWLGVSPFEKSGIAQSVRDGRPPANFVALNQQHRMRPQIGGAIGCAFYPEANLQTAPSVTMRAARTVSYSAPQTVLIDTSGLRSPIARRGGFSSRYNLMHAQLVINAIQGHDRNSSEAESVGLISPFAPQAKLLQALAPDDDPRVVASTVHRFQGGETDVVLFDSVESAGGALEPHSWFTETYAGSEGARLMNVAMSRAREQAILLADMGYIYRKRPKQTPVRQFLRELDQRAHQLSWTEIANGEGPTSMRTDLSGLLANAQASGVSIDIFSSDLTGPATRALVEILTSTPESVRIGVWYQPERGWSLPQVLQPLQHHHATLHPLRPVRESCVVIDDVVWAAAGPILGRSPGPLFRTGHAGLASSVRKLLIRRSVNGVPGTGEHAERCRCGALLVRAEYSGGPRAGVRSECDNCGD